MLLGSDVAALKLARESGLLALAMEDCTVTVMDIDTRQIVRNFPGHRYESTSPFNLNLDLNLTFLQGRYHKHILLLRLPVAGDSLTGQHGQGLEPAHRNVCRLRAF